MTESKDEPAHVTALREAITKNEKDLAALKLEVDATNATLKTLRRALKAFEPKAEKSSSQNRGSGK